METPQQPNDEREDLRLRVRMMYRFSLFMLAGAVLSIYSWQSAPAGKRSFALLVIAAVFFASMLIKILLAARWQARLRQLERK